MASEPKGKPTEHTTKANAKTGTKTAAATPKHSTPHAPHAPAATSAAKPTPAPEPEAVTPELPASEPAPAPSPAKELSAEQQHAVRKKAFRAMAAEILAACGGELHGDVMDGTAIAAERAQRGLRQIGGRGELSFKTTLGWRIREDRDGTIFRIEGNPMGVKRAEWRSPAGGVPATWCAYVEILDDDKRALSGWKPLTEWDTWKALRRKL